MRTSYRDRLEKYRAISNAVYARAKAEEEEAERRNRPTRMSFTLGECAKRKRKK